MPTSAGTTQMRCSPLVGKNQLLREHQLYHTRMKNMKSVIDQAPPETTKIRHLKHRLNTRKIKEDRYEAIRKENFRLFTKMLDIKQKGTARTGGLSPQTVSRSTESKFSRSKNYPARKARHKLIQQHNKRHHQRIKAATPVLPSSKALASDFRKHRAHAKIACRGSRVNWNNSTTARERRQRRAAKGGPVFCPELQRKLNPECIPMSQLRRRPTSAQTGRERQRNDDDDSTARHEAFPERPQTSPSRAGSRASRRALHVVSQGVLPPEPAGMEDRGRSRVSRKSREKLGKFCAQPEERPPRFFDHPGLSRRSDLL